MTKRKIEIEIEFPDAATDSDERYADTANAVWMLLKAVSEPSGFDFWIHHDDALQDSDLSDALNARWRTYGQEARWG
ncbi:hypothetical protein R4172_14220 [Rhodococcus kroppenstedtii]|uniref:hypothetical protein n=1 Tax=Rhodococcoides kroppenstedtii TaxID=293050 RepID=UPI00295505BD|nr:hypothetical protein [Rhodococcus kroppenstedtii]MDV7198708.1 hypothetical protein [Rhodococcus kroppenstedtii]